MKQTTVIAALLALLVLCMFAVGCTPTGSEETDTTEDTSTPEEVTTEAETEDIRFDYFEADVSQFVTVDPSVYADMQVTLSQDLLVDDNDLTRYIMEMQFDNRGEAESDTMVDEPLEWGDDAYIYYTGYVEGVAFEGGSNMSNANPSQLGLGSSDFIDGFEAGLVGVIPSETSKENPVRVSARFPSWYTQADLAGKEAVFEVYVVYAVEHELPAYDVAFVRDVLLYEFKQESYTDDSERLAEFEAQLRTHLEKSMVTLVEEATFNAMWEYLLGQVTFASLPEEELAHYRNSYLDEIDMYYEYYTGYGYNVGTYDEFACTMLGLAKGSDWKAEITKSVTRTVQCDVVRYAVAEIEGMKLITEAEMEAEIQYWVDYYRENYSTEMTKDKILETLGQEALYRSAMVQKMHTFLLEHVTVSYATEA